MHPICYTQKTQQQQQHLQSLQHQLPIAIKLANNFAN